MAEMPPDRAVMESEEAQPRKPAARRRAARQPKRASKQKSAETTARHDAEEALRENQAALEFTLEAAQVGDWDLDLASDTSRRSLRHDRAFGYDQPIPEAEWGFERFMTHVHPDDRARVGEAFRVTIAELKPLHLESRVLWPDGSLHWIEVHGNIYRRGKEKPTRLLGIVMNITARKRAEEELRLSNQRISNIVESITDGFVTYDKEWRFTYLNDKALEILQPLQKTRENLIGKDFWEEFPDLRGSELERTYRRSLAQQVPVRMELYYAPLSSWIELRAYPSRDGLTVYFQDISERRQAEVEAGASAERLRFMAESMPQKIFTARPSGEVDYFNAQWVDYTGLTFEQIRAWGWLQFIHPDDVDENVRSWQHSVATGEPFELLHRFRRADGEYRWHLSRAQPMRDAAGAITMWIGSNTEIHEQRQLQEMLREREEALRESEAHLRLLLDSAAGAFYAVDANGATTNCNAAFLRMLGFAREEEAIGRKLHDVVHHTRADGSHYPKAECPIYRAASQGTPAHVENERFFRVDGSSFPVEYWTHPIMRDGKVTGAITTFIDITERREAEQALQHAKQEAEAANQAKDRFLAMLSHELRTPLTPVLMSAAMLQQDERLPADLREQLEMMERNIELEARLIDDMLDLTRIVHGKLSLRTQLCDAHVLLGLALDMVKSEAAAKRQKLEVDLAATLTQLSGDPARLQQVFWNLLRNAVKFTPNGGLVRVRTCDYEDHFTLEVSDSGIGISEDFIGRIFAPFEQGAVTAVHRAGGLGLGLSIAKSIVDLHHGKIEAESGGPGAGSTFRVEVPSWTPPIGADISDSANGTLNGREEPAPFVPLRLLLVEDHVPTLEVLERMLQRTGHQVWTASTIAQALEVAGRERFDAVVSDLGLPDGTGFELMEKLRAAHDLRGVALSGYGMDEDLRRSREAGFDAHLTKPINFAQLERALEDIQNGKPAR